MAGGLGKVAVNPVEEEPRPGPDLCQGKRLVEVLPVPAQMLVLSLAKQDVAQVRLYVVHSYVKLGNN